MASPFLGEIAMFGGNFAPVGRAFCSGQLISIAQNSALFALLGTTYGGDGVNTFGLPNLQGRVPVHFGTGPGLPTYVQGQTGGAESVTVTSSQLPAHSHTISSSSSTTARTTTDPTGAIPANASVAPYTASSGSSFGASMIGPSGGSQPHSNMMPYLCVNFIIALAGIFPSRN